MQKGTEEEAWREGSETAEKGSKAAHDPGMKVYTVIPVFKKLRQEGCSQFAQGQCSLKLDPVSRNQTPN